MFDVEALGSPKGKVELIETIGKGNFGFVYRGRMIESNKIAAIKVVALKEDELKEILLEVEILRDCHHANIVNYLVSYVRNEDLWICMEFCGGGAVDSLYKSLPRLLTEDEIAVFMCESLKGLAYLHSLNIIHRDIKSGNLLLTENGDVKLADFGVSAQLVAARGFRANTFIGTPYWMAPEVILAENSQTNTYDCKADVWSIGITSIELGDKNPPMSDIHPMRALYLIPTADPKVLMLQNPKKWSKTFVDFIQTCLVKDPKKRLGAEEILKHQFFSKLDLPKSNKIVRDLVNTVKAAKGQNEKGKKNQVVTDDKQSDEEVEEYAEVSKGSEPDKNPQEHQAPAQQANSKSPGLGENSSSLKKSNSSLNSHKTSLTSAFKGMFRNKHAVGGSNGKDELEFSKEAVEDDFVNITSNILKHGTNTAEPYDLVHLDLRLHNEILGCDLITLEATAHGNPDSKTFSFLLIGTEKGLLAADVTNHQSLSPQTPYTYHDNGPRLRHLLKNTRFKDICVIEDYGIVAAIAGRTSKIRSYNINSLRNLIRFVFGLGVSPNDETAKEVDDHMTLQEDIVDGPLHWSNDYVKILNTADAITFNIQRTRSTIYMGVMCKDDVTIFEWAKLPYLRFMKVKQFWLPETAKSFEIFHDGEKITELMVVYQREANLIEFESSQVKDVVVLPEFEDSQAKEVRKDKDQFRWRTWIQMPNTSVKPESTAPEVAKSWYHTIKSMQPKKQGSAAPPRDYLATFGTRSLLTNNIGEISTSTRTDINKRILWDDIVSSGAKNLVPEAPSRILLTSTKHILCVTKSYVEVRDSITGNCLQVFASQSPLKVLVPHEGNSLCVRRQGRFCFSSYNKKMKCTQIYWLKEKSFDFIKQESFYSKRDKVEKASKVIGTGAIVAQKKNML